MTDYCEQCGTYRDQGHSYFTVDHVRFGTVIIVNVKRTGGLPDATMSWDVSHFVEHVIDGCHGKRFDISEDAMKDLVERVIFRVEEGMKEGQLFDLEDHRSSLSAEILEIRPNCTIIGTVRCKSTDDYVEVQTVKSVFSDRKVFNKGE